MIFLDITRLIRHLDTRTPTGIDRVEFEYARHLLQQRSGFVAINSQQLVQVPRWLVIEILDHLTQRWHSGADGNPSLGRALENWKRMSNMELRTSPIDSFFADLVRRKGQARWRLIQSEKAAISERAGAFPWWLSAPALYLAPKLVARFITPSFKPLGSKQGIVLNRASAKILYLNVGHLNLERREIFAELRNLGDVSLAFYVHDLLPMSHPDLFSKGLQAKHELAIKTMIECADHIFTNSNFTRDEVLRLIPGNLKTTTLEIGLSEVERKDIVPAEDRRGFASVGTLEPRKNYKWLMQNWLKFCEDNPALVGDETLTIFGKKGWIDAERYDELMRIAESSKHLRLVSGASDEELAQTLSHARGYLSAAHVEGWGMPLAEALAHATPVIASNIAAHREVTGGNADFFDLNDGAAFSDILAQYFDVKTLGRKIEGCERFTPWSWQTHFEKLHQTLGH